MDGLADPDTIRARADEIRQRIRDAGDREGRVTLVAVTKGFGPELVTRALDAGLVDLGENYAQELAAKAAALAADGGARTAPGPRWHFIGGLQTNKVKLLVGLVDVWQTIDRPSLVESLARRGAGARILVQVNTTGEDQKSGCSPAEAPALVELARERGLAVMGLMTIGPTGGADPRPGFSALRDLAGRCAVTELSMGMSGDYEAAVAEGATMVRIGSALFGSRPGATKATA